MTITAALKVAKAVVITVVNILLTRKVKFVPPANPYNPNTNVIKEPNKTTHQRLMPNAGAVCPKPAIPAMMIQNKAAANDQIFVWVVTIAPRLLLRSSAP